MAAKKSNAKSNNLNQLNGIANKFAILMFNDMRENIKKSSNFDFFNGRDDLNSINLDSKVQTEKKANLLKFAPNLLSFIVSIVENLQDCTSRVDKAYLDSVNYSDNGLIAFVRDMARIGRDVYKVATVDANGVQWNDKIKSQIELFVDNVNLYAKTRNDQKQLQGVPQLSFVFAGITCLAMDHMLISPAATYDITDLMRDLLHLYKMNTAGGLVSTDLLKFLNEKQPKPVERKPREKKPKATTNKVENVQSNSTSSSSEQTTTTDTQVSSQSFDF